MSSLRNSPPHNTVPREQHPDATDKYPVKNSKVLFDGPIIAVRQDTISGPTGDMTREIVEHFSAVAIAPVRDGKVLLIRQYRHGVGRYLWEIPAGLLDMAGEAPLDAARRELAEEAGLAAGQWHLLGDVVTSPGFCEEFTRIYLAENLTEDLSGLEFDLPEPEHEEADLETRWVPIPEAIEWVQSGKVENSIAVAAILHLAAGTKRDVTEPYYYYSGMAARRAGEPGQDMKFVR
ncbi:putative NTP pyrophosphohydrolase [Corynebacterium resistens DSM 45100]|uniref:NTP pyrophosphohydrolase n=1 Tax=Corynebacterium resistens (strain DSM 45100 / JCM 12819 / GTC 2026 / SICGH 158) TaxID=662755 RepID=F8E1Q9_CORRG|nr:NUDIX hydrolase [Corynebacterium resistens]AEI09326.1 putative NTP pyrophosphohydrolase [Corynebacterium resistens DSM 45100]